MMQWSSWALNNPALAFFLLILAIFVLKGVLLYLLKNHSLIYYGVLFPGVVIHELSHVLACLLTGTRIKKVSLFNSSGGYVEYEKPGFPIVSDLFISVFPLVVGLAIVFVALKYLPPPTFENLSAGLVLKDILASYAILSVILCMLPSFPDFKNATLGYIGLTVIVILVNEKFLKLSISDDVIKILIFCAGALVVVNLVVILGKIFRFVR